MLYTRKGDNGSSGLFGNKLRLPKNSPIYDALGTLDELNSVLGLCRATVFRDKEICTPGITAEVLPELLNIQECLFVIQAELAGANQSITQAQVYKTEDTIDYIEKLIPPTHSFLIPGSTIIEAWCDYARTVCRRAERAVITAQSHKALSDPTMAYLNRLSSLLYSLARYSAFLAQTPEPSPSYKTH